MPALSGLVLATMLVPSPAARAGSWTYVVTGDNTGTTFTDNGQPGYVPPYSPATSGSGSGVSIPGYNIDRGGNGPSGSGCDIHVVVNAQITFTWVPTAGQTDPPPPNVLVLESANAGWAANSGTPNIQAPSVGKPPTASRMQKPTSINLHIARQAVRRLSRTRTIPS